MRERTGANAFGCLARCAQARLELIREQLASGAWAPLSGAEEGDSDGEEAAAAPAVGAGGGRDLASRVASAELAEAIRFSVALYEHRDLSGFPLDRRREEEDVEVVPRRGVPLELGPVALAELELGGVICRHRPGADGGGAGAQSAGPAAGRPRAACAAWHAAALRRVLAGERVAAAGSAAAGAALLMQWADVLATRGYQAACMPTCAARIPSPPRE